MAPFYRGPMVELSSEVKAKIDKNGEFTLFLHLHGRKMERHQLGAAVHRFLNLDGRVEVSDEGHCRYSAKFSSQRDYDRAIQRSRWKISNHCSIEVYRWQPNIQFGKVPLFVVGDMVEVRVDRLPVEYRINDVVTKVAEAICALFGCDVYMVDTSRGKPPRFWCRSARNRSLELPAYVQLADGPLVGLTYSRAHAYDSPQARRCYDCGRFGHIRRNCPELSQWIRRSPNRATPSNFSPTQVRRPQLDQEPVPHSDLSPPPSVPEETRGGVQSHESVFPMSSEESHEETTSSEKSHEGSTSSITPFSTKECFDRCSGSISPSRPIEETEMGPEGAMIVENGEESKLKCYNLGEMVSEIDGTVNVTQLNDQRGNQRRVIITPHAGHACRYSKRVLYASIDSADIRGTIRAIKDTCDGNHVSLAIVLDKSSFLINDDQIIRRFGFSDSHCVEMTFRTFGSDGSAIDVKGNCLLMRKREKVHVYVSPVSYGNRELLSQNLEFNASWLVVESDDSSSGEEDESPHVFTSSGEEDSSDSSISNSSDESSVYPSNGNTDSAGSSLSSAAREELPNDESVSDSEEMSLFSTSEEQSSYGSSSSNGSSSESFIFLPNRATDSEESSLFSTDAEEISNQSSAPSSSEEGDESFVLIRDGDWD